MTVARLLSPEIIPRILIHLRVGERFRGYAVTRVP
jgi:hypothetical protein